VIGKFGPFEFRLSERYRFEEELGRGAMGTVYRAKDVRLGRPVAIKILHPALTNDLGVSRFQSEIRIAANLHHANIVGVHESGEADGRLFYVMDYIGGESLRALLKRERQLSPEDALRIVDDVAEGLQYAHDHGVVHRDVKPENIMLAEGRACIVDFGLALALGDVDAKRLTASGLSVGTPHYLSPEQASAEREIGPRADQYALACVLFEMLIGEPPFTGPTGSSIAMRHISENPPPMRSRRKTVPPGVEAAVLRAMEKVPADRFPSVKAFAAACRAEVAPSLPPPAGVNPRGKIRVPVLVGSIAVGTALLVGVVLARGESSAATAIDDGVRFLTGRSLDTTRYVVLPFATNERLGTAPDVQSRLSTALGRWSGVSIPGDIELRSVLNDSLLRATPANGNAIARRLGAARYIQGVVTGDEDSLHVRAELLDVRRKSPPRYESVALARGARNIDSAMVHLANSLLFDGDEMAREAGAARGTRSRQAFDSYLRGKAAMRTWNLVLADSAFSTALRFDAAFPQAALGLAQVRVWARDEVPELTALVGRVLESSKTSSEERVRARALEDIAAARYPEACARFDSLSARDSLDLGAWLGVSECNLRDRQVVADPKSPSGFRFRGKLHRAQLALDRAFNLVPHLDSCCSSRATDLIRRSFAFVSYTQVRYGMSANSSRGPFGAYPELVRDTVSFVPYPMASRLIVPAETHAVAVQRQRDGLYAFAAKRSTLAPQSADALELLAEALELRGNIATIDSTRRARALTKDPHQELRLAVRETWLRVKFAMPGNLSELHASRIFAESLLKHAPVSNANDASLLSSLAALTGDANAAARLAERSAEQSGSPVPVPMEVLGTARALLAYAALGGPADSLRAFESRLSTGIASGVAIQQQSRMRDMYLARAAALAYPAFRAAGFKSLDTTSDYLLSAEAAHARGDKRTVRSILAAIAKERTRLRPSDLTLDALYPEAWLLASIGDTAQALLTIAPTLDAIRNIPVPLFYEMTMAGALVQAMSLRADLSFSQGEQSTGSRWARAVQALSSQSSVVSGVQSHRTH
jgi:hypothetical protein